MHTQKISLSTLLPKAGSKRGGEAVDPGRRILLVMLPFWFRESPPLGIAALKGDLVRAGYRDVVCQDFNADDQLWAFFQGYIEKLRSLIPSGARNNFFHSCQEVLVVHLNSTLERTASVEQRLELVQLAIRENFFVDVERDPLRGLDESVLGFFSYLDTTIDSALEQHQPDVIGVSVFTPNLATSIHFLERAKRWRPSVRTIMGGGIFTDVLERQAENLQAIAKRYDEVIDEYVIGEGEVLLEAFLRGDFSGGQRIVSGIDVGGETLDLSNAPAPDFSDFEVDRYLHLSFYVTRSCPYQCSFCGETVLWGKFRKKRIEDVIAELRMLKTRFNKKFFMLADSLINPVINQFTERLIEADLGIHFDGHLRIDVHCANPDKTRRWARAGYYRARLGIESGSQRILDLMDKRTTLQQIKDGIKGLADAGIKTTIFIIVGHPEETEDDFVATLQLISELRDYIYEVDWHPFVFFPEGLVSSEEWKRRYGIRSLYPDNYDRLLLVKRWYLDCSPSRAEIFSRMNRMSEACKQFGTPQMLTSIMDITRADRRWNRLRGRDIPSVINVALTKQISELSA